MNRPTWSQYERLRLRYKRAAENLSWIGSMDPDSHEEVRCEYDAALTALNDLVASLLQERDCDNLRCTLRSRCPSCGRKGERLHEVQLET